MSQKFGFACNDGDASGIRPRREDGQAANILIGVNYPLVRGHPEAVTDRDEIHCGNVKNILNTSRVNICWLRKC